MAMSCVPYFSKMIHSSDIELTDLFCGCGGSTEGASNVGGVKVTYAMNHWPLAVQSHNTNHPDTHHDCADISETHPARYRKTTGLIGSPECTNHSLSKGVRRKNLNQQELFNTKGVDLGAIRSRATMWDIVRFAEVHRYEFCIVENVVEVRYWELYEPWIKAMHALGYNHKCVFLNSMHAHGHNISGFAPQSRDRIYIVFWKKGNKAPNLEIRPLAPCPKCGIKESFQSWKNGRIAGKYKTQYVYRCSCCNEIVTPFYYAAANAIDFSLPMVKIGEREKRGMKPLSEKTMQRIQYGMDKFGLKPMVIDQRNMSGSERARIRDAYEATLNSQTTGYSSYLFAPYLIDMAFTHSGEKRANSSTEAMSTQTTKVCTGLVSPFVLSDKKNSTPKGFDETLPTITTRANSMYVVSPSALLTMRGNRSFSHLTDPMGTQVAAGIQDWLVSKNAFLTPYHGTFQAATILDPTYTIPTKDSLSLIETHSKIAIEDCYFRMLQPSETALAQGFPRDYVILGNKEEKQKQIGNANPPPTMELLVQRCVESLL